MISEAEVKKLAQLARLKLTAQEIVNLQKDLEAILGYVSKLQKVEIREAAARNGELVNVLRSDVEKSNPTEADPDLLFQRPRSGVGRALPVKAVFDHDRGRA